MRKERKIMTAEKDEAAEAMEAILEEATEQFMKMMHEERAKAWRKGFDAATEGAEPDENPYAD